MIIHSNYSSLKFHFILKQLLTILGKLLARPLLKVDRIEAKLRRKSLMEIYVNKQVYSLYKYAT